MVEHLDNILVDINLLEEANNYGKINDSVSLIKDSINELKNCLLEGKDVC